MSSRYTMTDTVAGNICGRYNNLARAMRDIAVAVGTPGRFTLTDNHTKQIVAESGNPPRTGMAFGRFDEQATCTLIGGEVVR